MTELGVVLPLNRKGGIAYYQDQRKPGPKNRNYRRIQGQRAHRLIVELRTGIKLPATAVVHHFAPHDKRSNKGPFVVCEDNAYHNLIERRQRALLACGHAGWRKCRECRKYDDPANMRIWKDTTRPGCDKVAHYRFWGECVNADEPRHVRRPHLKPGLRRGQKRKNFVHLRVPSPSDSRTNNE